MMSDIAIRVSNLTKKYQLYDNPKDRVKEALHPLRKKYHKDFYALNDVSFEIKKGETVGIIGKNGAGKSTLLKIVTGVLTPTSGRVEVYGKISSLLELGAGFNPEMTGIENIYLNGLIMGFSREEIDLKLQAILDFADIGDFVRQKVKMYSSGMFARLAFAVAINVEPDILVVDEALSVGDVRFQRKCFAKIDELSKRGVTIILVSHDLESIKTFTSRSFFICDGALSFSGGSKECVIHYLQYLFGKKNEDGQLNKFMQDSSETSINKPDGCVSLDKLNSKLNFGNGNADFNYLNIYGLNSNVFHGGENVRIEYEIVWNIDKIRAQFNVNEYDSNLIVGLHLVDKKGNTFFGLNTVLNEILIDPVSSSKAKHIVKFDMPFIAGGDYFLTAAIAYGSHENHVQLNWYEDGIALKCVGSEKHMIGFLRIPCKITIGE